MVLLSVIIAAFLFTLTTVIHSGGMILAIRLLRKQEERWKRQRRKIRVYMVSGTVLLMFLISLFEVLAYTLTYLALNAVPTFKEAFYFSMVTFTTLGYGDIVLNDNWRLLASFQAANGIIMFGWTSAIVMAFVHNLYFTKEQENE